LLHKEVAETPNVKHTPNQHSIKEEGYDQEFDDRPHVELCDCPGQWRGRGRETYLEGSASGTYVNTQTDTDGVGAKASLNSLGAKGTLGVSTIQGVNEFVLSGSATCPNGNAGDEYTLLRSLNPAAPANFLQWFESTGDLIFFEQTSGTLCFDPATSIQFFSATTKITGGAGRFEGATGTGEVSGTAKVCLRMTRAISSVNKVVRLRRPLLPHSSRGMAHQSKWRPLTIPCT
jgi:hypothetical protein